MPNYVPGLRNVENLSKEYSDLTQKCQFWAHVYDIMPITALSTALKRRYSTHYRDFCLQLCFRGIVDSWPIVLNVAHWTLDSIKI